MRKHTNKVLKSIKNNPSTARQLSARFNVPVAEIHRIVYDLRNTHNVYSDMVFLSDGRKVAVYSA